MVHDDIEVSPGSELSLPVSDGRERGDNEERPLDPCTTDLLQKCDGLDGLSQTHLIRQNTVTPANWDRGASESDFLIFPHTRHQAIWQEKVGVKFFFSYSSSFPIKMFATDAKMQKIEPDPIFFNDAVCKRDWHKVRSYLFFYVRKFQTKCAMCL